jgi:hypothetical protein
VADGRDPVHTLALFIFRLGVETAEIKAIQKELLEKSKAEAFDAGFALGRETAEQEAEDGPGSPDEVN